MIEIYWENKNKKRVAIMVGGLSCISSEMIIIFDETNGSSSMGKGGSGKFLCLERDNMFKITLV